MDTLISLLLNEQENPEGISIDLPDSDHNIFNRIIRDPGTRWANERRCSEMLCVILLNSPVLRKSIFRWFAKLADHKIPGLSNMIWTLQTEENADGKSMDFTIRGRQAKKGRYFVLWVIEIKVGANFHMSSSIADSGEIKDDDETPIDVNQVLNYDLWLRRKNVRHKAGFVLSIPDSTSNMPKGLQEKWHCLTWTSLGLHLNKLLADNDCLPPAERMLARHLLGFIKRFLWRDIEMVDNNLTFEDVAMVKAAVERASIVEKKVSDLVFSLRDVIEDSGFGAGKFGTSKNLYTPSNRNAIWRSLFSDIGIWFVAGITKGEISVSVECEKKYTAFLEPAVKKIFNDLKKLNENWVNHYSVNEQWKGLHITIPIEKLLNCKDQSSLLKEFVKKTLKELKQVKLIETIEQEFSENGIE